MTFAKLDVLELLKLIRFINVFKKRERELALFLRGIFVYALRDGAEHRHVKSSLAECMRLNGQIHAKMCQNAALSDYSRKPSPVM